MGSNFSVVVFFIASKSINYEYGKTIRIETNVDVRLCVNFRSYVGSNQMEIMWHNTAQHSAART